MSSLTNMEKSKWRYDMSDNKYSLIDVIQAMIADDSWEADPQKRAQIAYALYGYVYSL